jgi:hypothetical protein
VEGGGGGRGRPQMCFGGMCKNSISSSSSRNKVYFEDLGAKYINASVDELDFLDLFKISRKSEGFFCKMTKRTPARHVGPETRRGEQRGWGFKNSDVTCLYIFLYKF